MNVTRMRCVTTRLALITARVNQVTKGMGSTVLTSMNVLLTPILATAMLRVRTPKVPSIAPAITVSKAMDTTAQVGNSYFQPVRLDYIKVQFLQMVYRLLIYMAQSFLTAKIFNTGIKVLKP